MIVRPTQCTAERMGTLAAFDYAKKPVVLGRRVVALVEAIMCETDPGRPSMSAVLQLYLVEYDADDLSNTSQHRKRPFLNSGKGDQAF